jgi:ssDNA-binding Zn-finger/Zn-ribbon topoisomerase 1
MPRRRFHRRQPIAFLPTGCHNHGKDSQQRRTAFDLLDMARCPRCGAPLVARMRRGGPYFHCLCAPSCAA